MTARRTFFAALALSLCLLGLLLAFFVINYNIRYTIYGRVDFPLSYTMAEGLPVLTDETGAPLWSPPGGLYALPDAPTRLLLELYAWLCNGIAYLTA